MGWGYVEADFPISCLNDIIDHVNLRPSLPEDGKFVMHFLREGKFEQMLML
jgi:hypothetical protein